MAPPNRRRGPGGGPSPREVTVSKAMSFVLRHGAEKEGIKLDAEGYANVADLLAWHKLRKLHVTLAELQSIVANNDKQRFSLARRTAPSSPPQPPSSARPTTTTTTNDSNNKNPPQDVQQQQPPQPPSSPHTLPPPPEPPHPPPPPRASKSPHPPPNDNDNDPTTYRIRATQGHSIATLTAHSLSLTPLTPTTAPALIVHGTTPTAWRQILVSGGLSRMGRNHIHFATDVPDYVPLEGVTAEKTAEGEEGGEGREGKIGEGGEGRVISGMRKSATVLVWVDVRRAMEEGGLGFWRSENGVVLCSGDERGCVGLGFVARVVQRVSGGVGERVLWEGGSVVGEVLGGEGRGSGDGKRGMGKAGGVAKRGGGGGAGGRGERRAGKGGGADGGGSGGVDTDATPASPAAAAVNGTETVSIGTRK